MGFDPRTVHTLTSGYTEHAITVNVLAATLVLLFAPLSKQKPVDPPIYLKRIDFFLTEKKNFVIGHNVVVENALKIHAYGLTDCL